MAIPFCYSCCNCRNLLAYHHDLASKGFQSKSGRAFLFDRVANVSVGKQVDRELRTGLHVVADITCRKCKQILGWKYERAYNEAQRYKEGKYILEKAKIYFEE